MKYNPDQIYQQLVEAGEEWADKKSAYELLNDMTKSVLADIKISYPGSDASKTSMAQADTKYQEHLSDVADARRKYLYSMVKYDSMKALSDHRRTEQATRRAEITHI